MTETILITGAGSGLGQELAVQYSQSGKNIVLAGRSLDKLYKVQSMINEAGGRAFVYKMDIRKANEIELQIPNLLKEYNVSMLINNAGIGYFGSLPDLTYSNINDMIETNVTGTINLTKACLPYLLSLPEAKVMNIISTAGLRGKVNESAYVASKFAIRGFTESLIKELEHTSVSLTAVYMGGMDTPFWEESDHIKDKNRLRSPLEVAQKIIELDDGRPEIIIE
ncbi:SDR family NAD(P)-dependent oxidoreductase [Cytobacillus sp. IB215665]|uniref:SDR family NAD(P)-dependent oxidoreductase n=1 Tax=Cytobacillus sp. IB215665 TaxID=3097357 RepID=UPI002A134452|nr:SDR family NAD(P)-dependent oxidoreductase [Cytobacillus sp. IB215665]MDX8367272.1 SDR family NAD(P)-dependent oxidoreductase [Cytobacillus sp. IB215665]